MDTNQSPQTPKSVPEKKKFNGLLFLEVGLAEVFSVIFVLLLIFGILNYFGILPISQSIPLLSFLPQKQKIITNKTVKTNAPGKSSKQLPVEPRIAVGGKILSIDKKGKTIRVRSREAGGDLVIRVTGETKINIFEFTFKDSNEPLPSLKFDDLKIGYTLSVLTVETEPGLTEVTAREVRVTSIL